MIVKELYAVCDYCRKRVLLQECNSISTRTFTWIRNNLHWTIGRNGKFVCNDCKRKYIL